MILEENSQIQLEFDIDKEITWNIKDKDSQLFIVQKKELKWAIDRDEEQP